MPYATQTDLISRYGTSAVTTVSDRDGNGAIDTDAVTAALADATSLMNSYLGRQYDLPLTVESDELTRACADIAMYRLGADAATGTDELRRRYEDALAWLRDVARGVATLGQVSEPVTLSSTVEFDSMERIATRDTLRGL